MTDQLVARALRVMVATAVIGLGVATVRTCTDVFTTLAHGGVGAFTTSPPLK